MASIARYHAVQVKKAEYCLISYRGVIYEKCDII